MENIKSTVEHLQDLIDARNDMKSSINNKGVQVSGGLMSYAYAIDRIPQTIVNEGDLKVGMIDVEYTSNGQYNINPVNYKYDALSGVNLNINVPIKKVGTDKLHIFEKNGSYTINAKDYGYDGLSQVDLDINVPPQESTLNTSSVSVSYDKNGDYIVKPSDFGYDAFDDVNIKINVPNTGGGGSDIDFTVVGWSQEESNDANTREQEYINNALQYTLEKYGSVSDYLNWEWVLDSAGEEMDTKISPFECDYMLVVAPNIINFCPTQTSGLDCAYTFTDCYSLRHVPKFELNESTSTYWLFKNCHSLTSIPYMDTSKITHMNSMFDGCWSLRTIPLLDSSSCTNMINMFSNCYSLRTIPLLDTSRVTDTYGMFRNCTSLETIPLLDLSKVTRTDEMFYGCTSLHTIPLLDLSKVTTWWARYMFQGCTSLKNIGGFKNLTARLYLTSCTLLTIESLENIANTVAHIYYGNFSELLFDEEWLIRISDEYPDRVENAIETLTNKNWYILTS